MSGARQRVVAAVGCVSFLLAACATRGPVENPSTMANLGFLQAGGPTRTEVEARLGPPEHTYESGRIATYTIGEREGRLTMNPSQYSPLCTLVIEYEPDGTVARRSLVRQVK